MGGGGGRDHVRREDHLVLKAVRYAKIKMCHRTSLAVQWLGLRASTAGGEGSILVGELRSRMLHGAAKKKSMSQSL